MTLTRKQQRAINNLKLANKYIFEAEMLLTELNGINKQFDFVNCPELVNIIDGINIKSEHITKIVYQQK